MILFSSILILSALLFIFNILLFVRLRRVFCKGEIPSQDEKISIVIAAKNESGNLPSLFISLEKLNYPGDDFEVIIVDDNSSDETSAILSSYKGRIKNYTVLRNSPETPGKKNALTRGIAEAVNPFIIITDSDCRPEPGWLRSFSNKAGENKDLIFGIAPFYSTGSFINRICCFENLRTQMLTFASAESGFPYSAAARNFGFKKSSFSKLRGYAHTMVTLGGDDDLLLREAVKNKMKIGIITDQNSFVFSFAKNSFRDYLNQKCRHTRTSFYYLSGMKIFLSAWHIINILFLFSPFLFFFNPVFILPFLLKLTLDLINTEAYQEKFTYRFNPFQIILFQIIYELLLIIIFFSTLIRKDKW